MEAKDLQVGSLLQTEDGRVIDVDKIEKRSGQFQVYNFSVEGFHTYFVSELGILVHNADYITLWRGVDKSHPGYPNAERGIAKPRGGHSDPELHNLGDTNSVFTSWTSNKSQAEYFASKYSGEGIVLEKNFEVPNKRLYESPDDYNEAETLVRGTVFDAEIIYFNRSQR